MKITIIIIVMTMLAIAICIIVFLLQLFLKAKKFFLYYGIFFSSYLLSVMKVRLKTTVKMMVGGLILARNMNI